MPESTRRDLSFSWNGLSLAGTLHLPSPKGRHPAVLMMQGSGPADRDGDGYFPPIRDTFLNRQIATFSFDKPGCGDSAGDWRDHALRAREDQALAALEVMRDHPAIDSATVGIWGQSQGGWLVQMLAARLSDLSFAIVNSGPSLDVVEQNRYGCEHTMRARGRSEDEIRRALVFVDNLHEAARQEADYATVEARLLSQARAEPWYGYLTADDAKDWAGFCKFVVEGYEPLDALARISCPFLAIFGGLDTLGPAWRSAQETGHALRRSGNADSTVVVFPAGDHRISDATTEEFVAGYLDLLGDWSARRSRTEPSERST
jgi:pimeloyl-ACP methyl ester carboxylesterase